MAEACPCEGGGVLVPRRCYEGECSHPAGSSWPSGGCPWRPCRCRFSPSLNGSRLLSAGALWQPPGYGLVRSDDHVMWVRLTEDGEDWTREGPVCWDLLAVLRWAWEEQRAERRVLCG